MKGLLIPLKRKSRKLRFCETILKYSDILGKFKIILQNIFI